MLDFLKKIFKDEEEKSAVEVSLQYLEEWIKEKAKPLTEDINQKTEEALMKVNEELQRARFNLEVLENAKLQNQNIPYKAKQYMEGNRKAYIKSISSFLGLMEINNRDYFYLVEFCKEFDSLINDLNHSTLRNFAILQEFFANEAGSIAQNLRNFDMIFKGLKSMLNGKKIVAVNACTEKAGSLKAKRNQKLSLGIGIKSIEAGLQLAMKEKDSLMGEIENFSKGGEHNNFLKLHDEKKKKEQEFYRDENQILQSFSVLERPLRKYSHVVFEHEEVVLDYLKDPIGTLVDDKNYIILGVLKNLEKMLIESLLQIDEKKKEKSIEEIKKLSKEFIGQFVKKYFSFRSEIEKLDNEMKSLMVVEKLKSFNTALEELNLSIERNGQEFEKLKDSSAKLDESIQGLTKEIQDSAKDIFNDEIKIGL